MKIKIGISLRIVEATEYTEKRDALSHDWSTLLEKLDVIPIFIPNTLSSVESFLDEINISGLILSSGDNIGQYEERDATEEILIKYAIKKDIPVLGVCRGMQLINKFYGGSVIETSNRKHVGNTHEIDLSNPPSRKLFTNDLTSVNSYHNNIITKDILGKNLEPFAVCKMDNTIEGFIHKQHDISGVMWHPEREPDNFNQVLIKKIFDQESS